MFYKKGKRRRRRQVGSGNPGSCKYEKKTKRKERTKHILQLLRNWQRRLGRPSRPESEFPIFTSSPGKDPSTLMRLCASRSRSERPSRRRRSRIFMKMMMIIRVKMLVVNTSSTVHSTMVMMMLRMAHCVSSITTCTNVLQSFETFVKMRISMQFEI